MSYSAGRATSPATAIFQGRVRKLVAYLAGSDLSVPNS
jgi:hypothetical protein